MSKQQMLARTGSIPLSRTANLKNYRLAFRKELHGSGVYATIVPANGDSVRGVAYFCNSHVMNQLDLFEGVAQNCYRRELLQVTIASGATIDCVTYIGESFANEDDAPSNEYLNRIISGATEHQLPASYIESIARLAYRSER